MVKPKKPKKPHKPVEARFPTKLARDAADAAIDALPASEPMTTYLDLWLETYRAANGVEKP